MRRPSTLLARGGGLALFGCRRTTAASVAGSVGASTEGDGMSVVSRRRAALLSEAHSVAPILAAGTATTVAAVRFASSEPAPKRKRGRPPKKKTAEVEVSPSTKKPPPPKPDAAVKPQASSEAAAPPPAAAKKKPAATVPTAAAATDESSTPDAVSSSKKPDATPSSGTNPPSSSGTAGDAGVVADDTAAVDEASSPASLGLGGLGFTKFDDPGTAPPLHGSTPPKARSSHFGGGSAAGEPAPPAFLPSRVVTVGVGNGLLNARQLPPLEVSIDWRYSVERRRHLSTVTATRKLSDGTSVSTSAAGFDARVATRIAAARALLADFVGSDVVRYPVEIGAVTPPQCLTQTLLYSIVDAALLANTLPNEIAVTFVHADDAEAGSIVDPTAPLAALYCKDRFLPPRLATASLQFSVPRRGLIVDTRGCRAIRQVPTEDGNNGTTEPPAAAAEEVGGADIDAGSVSTGAGGATTTASRSAKDSSSSSNAADDHSTVAAPSGGLPVNVLGAYLLALEELSGAIPARDANRVAAYNDAAHSIDVALATSSASQPHMTLGKLLVAAFGAGMEIRDTGSRGRLFQATVHFAGEPTDTLLKLPQALISTVAPSGKDGSGSSDVQRIVLGIGVGTSKKTAQRSAVLDALARTFPRQFRQMRTWAAFIPPPIDWDAIGRSAPAGLMINTVPAPATDVSSSSATPAPAAGGASSDFLRAPEARKKPSPVNPEAAGTGASPPPLERKLKPLSLSPTSSPMHYSSDAEALGDVDHHQASAAPSAKSSKKPVSPEMILRHELASAHQLTLQIAQRSVDDYRSVDAEGARIPPGSVLWLTELTGVSADGTSNVELGEALHASRVASSVIAAVKALQYFYPETASEYSVQLPSAEGLEVPLVDHMKAAAARTPSPGASELAQLRRAVNRAVSDSWDSASGEGVAIEEKIFRPDDSGSPAPNRFVVQLSVADVNTPLATVASDCEPLALHAAYRLLFVSPLLDEELPPPEALAAVWLERRADNGGEAVDAASVPPLAVLATSASSSSRRTELLGSLRSVPDLEGVDIEPALRHLAAQRFGLQLHIVTALVGDECKASALLSGPRMKAPSTIAEFTSPSPRAAAEHVHAAVIQKLFPDAQRALRIGRGVVPVELVPHANYATVDDALRKALMAEKPSGKAAAVVADLDMEPAVVAELAIDATTGTAEVTLREHPSGRTLAFVAHDDDCKPLVALRHAFDTALSSPDAPKGAWDTAKTVRAKAAQLVEQRVPLNTGPAALASFLTARHHGMRLAFRTKKEQLFVQTVWHAEVVLCLDSSGEDLSQYNPVEVASPAEPQSTGAINPLTTAATATGDSGRSEAKKSAISKAAVRFLEGNFPKELDFARRSLPGLYMLDQSVEEEKLEVEHLRAEFERYQEERRLAAESRKAAVKRTLAQQRTDRHHARLAEMAVRHPTASRSSTRTIVRRSPGNEASSPDQQLPSATSSTSGGFSSSPKKTLPPGGGSRHDAQKASAEALVDLLRHAHEDSTGKTLRVAVHKFAGGYSARALSVPKRADGTLDLAAEEELMAESGVTKEAARSMLAYLLLQKHYPAVLIDAVENQPDLLSALL